MLEPGFKVSTVETIAVQHAIKGPAGYPGQPGRRRDIAFRLTQVADHEVSFHLVDMLLTLRP